MDLKDFIKQTIASIAEATVELQRDLKGTGVVINPPRGRASEDYYLPSQELYSYRQIERVKFDVAVSASEEAGTAGGGKLKVAALGIGASAGGEISERTAAENISRVCFSIGISLPPSEAGKKSEAKLARMAEMDEDA